MRLRNLLLAVGLAACLVSFGIAQSSAVAGPLPMNDADVAANSQPASQPQAVDNSLCLSCHAREGFTVELDSGEILPLTVNAEAFEASVHAANEVACVSCHTDVTRFPHPDRTLATRRDFTLTYSATCAQCHADQSALAMDSVHQKASAEGNRNAAVCADCHNPHTQQALKDQATGALLEDARLHIPATCAQCHSAIYDVYTESVHGAALTQEGNTDVPTCVDCHGVHNIQSPTTTTFRNSTPYLCATCHTDGTLMAKYGLSTQVLNTYVADFHGTTVEVFNKDFPDQPTNKPVCTDCHGVHDIAKIDDPTRGLAIRENLLVRCQACHPGAGENFPDAWLSHYIPSPENYPIVYYVNLFYKFMIPGVLVPMAILVVMDFTRKMINRYRKPKPAMIRAVPPVQPEETVQVEDAATPEEEAAAAKESQPVEAEPASAPEEPIESGETSAPEETQDDNKEAPHD